MDQNKQADGVKNNWEQEALQFVHIFCFKKRKKKRRYDNEIVCACVLLSMATGINWHEQTKWLWETLEFLRLNVIALTSSDETLNSPHAAIIEASASRRSCGHVWNRRRDHQVPSTKRLSRSFRNTRSGDRKLVTSRVGGGNRKCPRWRNWGSEKKSWL